MVNDKNADGFRIGGRTARRRSRARKGKAADGVKPSAAFLGVSSAGAYSGLLIHVVCGHKEVKLLAVLLLFLLDMV